MLSDPDLVAHEAFHVVNALDDAGVKRLERLGINLEAWSKRKHKKIAIPSLFLVDRDGTVLFAHAAHDYKTRPDTQQLIDALRKLPGVGAAASAGSEGLRDSGLGR